MILVGKHQQTQTSFLSQSDRQQSDIADFSCRVVMMTIDIIPIDISIVFVIIFFMLGFVLV